MTHMYGARGSFHVLRPKNTIKLLTQSAENWICMPRLSGGREKAEEDPARSLKARRGRGPRGGAEDSGDQVASASRKREAAAATRAASGAARARDISCACALRRRLAQRGICQE